MIAYRWHRCRVSLHFTRDVRTPRNSRARLAWPLDDRLVRPNPGDQDPAVPLFRSANLRTKCTDRVAHRLAVAWGHWGQPVPRLGPLRSGGHLRPEFVFRCALYRFVRCRGRRPDRRCFVRGRSPELRLRYHARPESLSAYPSWPGRTGFTAPGARGLTIAEVRTSGGASPLASNQIEPGMPLSSRAVTLLDRER
jgi:hypothetical protein